MQHFAKVSLFLQVCNPGPAIFLQDQIANPQTQYSGWQIQSAQRLPFHQHRTHIRILSLPPRNPGSDRNRTSYIGGNHDTKPASRDCVALEGYKTNWCQHGRCGADPTMRSSPNPSGPRIDADISRSNWLLNLAEQHYTKSLGLRMSNTKYEVKATKSLGVGKAWRFDCSEQFPLTSL